MQNRASFFHASRSASGFTLIEVLVALSILAVGVAGVAQLRHAAFLHISLTREIQEASYFADTHLNALSLESRPVVGYQAGEYSRGLEVQGYPWALTVAPIRQGVLRPESISLSTKVQPLTADLSVWVDQGARELHFHSLLLAEPLADEDITRPAFELGLKK